MNKKTLKEKKGFTLVECVVAMAVLVIMSLLLAMILSATVQQRNKNMELERAIDTQVEQIGNNAPTDSSVIPVEDVFNHDLVFKDDSGNAVKISGEGAVKKTFKDDNVQIGKLEYPEYDSSGGKGVNVDGADQVMLMTSHSTDNADGTVTYKVSFHFTKGDPDKTVTFTFNETDKVDSVSVTGAGESTKAGNVVIFSRKGTIDSPQYMSATIKFKKK